MTFSIVTDSASDIPLDFIKKEGIFIVPTLIMFGSNVYYDHEYARSEFITRLKNEEYATTSQSSPADFEKVYNQAIKENENVLGIHLSSKLSGLFNGALSVTNMIDNGKIYLVDSLSLSFGTGYLVCLAAYLRKKGKSIEQTVKILEQARNKIFLEILIDDIKYLKRSGRINISQYSLLKFFKLKPIINIIEGKLIRNALALGRNSGMKKISNRIQRYNVGDHPIIVFAHANTPHDTKKLANYIQVNKPSDVIHIEICKTLMAHTGPGVLGIGIAPSYESFLN